MHRGCPGSLKGARRWLSATPTTLIYTAPELSGDQVSDDKDKFADIEWLRQVSLITGDKRPFSIFRSRKRGKRQRGNPIAPRLLARNVRIN